MPYSNKGIMKAMGRIKHIEWIGLLFAVGLVLYLFSGQLRGIGLISTNSTDLEKRLEEVLGEVKGAGKVRVMIATQGEVVSAFSSQSSGAVQGVIVVCEGGDNLKVRLELESAVISLLKLDASSIEILKMKESEGNKNE